MKLPGLKPISLAVSGLLLNGCMLAPGMHMKTYSLTPSIDKQGEVVKPKKVQKINARLILKQRRQREISKELAIKNYKAPKDFTTNLSAYRYQVGPQDVLSIIVYDHPNLSNPTGSQTTNAENSGIIVDQQGYIYYPYIGRVKVGGLTTDQIRQELSKKLSTYIKEPQINVQVIKFNSHKIDVLGDAVSPQAIPLTTVPLNILDIANILKVSSCNGDSKNSSSSSNNSCADLRHIKIDRGTISTTVNLETLEAINGNPTNWLLQPGDKVFVDSGFLYRVYMLGAVGNTGPLQMFDDQLNLEQAIGESGGAAQTSDPTYTYVVRSYKHNPKIFVLNARSPDALILASEFQLKPQDVVFVSTSKLETFNQVLGQIMPSLTTYTFARNFTK